jgi:hypothetical protein
MTANEHSFDDSNFPGNRIRTLEGDGTVMSEYDLGGVPNDNNDPDPDQWMEDTTSSVEFFTNCADYYDALIGIAWDLNQDGFFETSGDNATFSAAQLDGPAIQQVSVEAKHPTDTTDLGRSQIYVDVLVANVAPNISEFGLLDSAGNQIGFDVPFALVNVPYTAQAVFTDPGTLDHQTAVLDWGDGSSEASSQFHSFSDAFGGAVGQLAHSHSYVSSGEFTLMLTVNDDDFLQPADLSQRPYLHPNKQ